MDQPIGKLINSIQESFGSGLSPIADDVNAEVCRCESTDPTAWNTGPRLNAEIRSAPNMISNAVERTMMQRSISTQVTACRQIGQPMLYLESDVSPSRSSINSTKVRISKHIASPADNKRLVSINSRYDEARLLLFSVGDSIFLGDLLTRIRHIICVAIMLQYPDG